MTATKMSTGPERDRLRAALDKYAADDIATMHGSHGPGIGTARRKAERIEQLTHALTDPEFARRAVSALSPLGRRLLAVAHHHDRTSLAALFLAGQGPGSAGTAVQRQIEELLHRGLLILDLQSPLHKFSLDLAQPASRLRWAWASRAVLEALPVDDLGPRLAPLPSAPARVETGQFALLRRDLYLALRFFKATGVRLTRTGEPHRTDLRKLALSLQPGQAPSRRAPESEGLDGRLLFLVRLLEATGLVQDQGGTLRADDGAETFLNQSEIVAAALLYEAWLDLAWDEFRRLPHLAIEPWSHRDEGDAPSAERIAAARRAIAAVLATASGEWIAVEAVADALRQTNPEFLIPRLPEFAPNYYNYASYSYAYSGGYYQNWQLQEQTFYRGFVRAEARGPDRRLKKDQDWQEVEGAFVAQVAGESLHWLGLVDAGFAVDVDRPVALRLTPLGVQVFTEAPPAPEPAASGTALVVQPNFEVLILDALAHLDLLARLDAFADAQSLDRAAIYRLTRPALVRGLEAGWTEHRVVALLEAESGAPLPQNVRHTLHDWAQEYERIHLYRDATLLEAPDAATLDRWLADAQSAPLLDRRLTPTTAILAAVDATPLTLALERGGVAVRATNYALDAPQILDLSGPGLIAAAPEDDDPYLRYRLGRFADCQDGAGPLGVDAAPSPTSGSLRYAVTPESLARAARSGLGIDEILSFLGYKVRTGLSPDDIVTLRGWAGYYAPFAWARVRAVELPPTVTWGDLGRIKALRPLILRVLSASLALVSEERWPQLEVALAERGITLKAGLDVQSPAERQSVGERDAAPRAAPRGATRPAPSGPGTQPGNSQYPAPSRPVLLRGGQLDPEAEVAIEHIAGRLGLITGRELIDDLTAARARPGRPVALQRLSGRALSDFIEDALDAELPLVIEYQKPGERGSAVRTVEPREFAMRGGSYYLRAFCRQRGQERDFRLSSIRGVALADE